MICSLVLYSPSVNSVLIEYDCNSIESSLSLGMCISRCLSLKDHEIYNLTFNHFTVTVTSKDQVYLRTIK
jgi:hypothetical protein